jgi:hypothetical protein
MAHTDFIEWCSTLERNGEAEKDPFEDREVRLRFGEIISWAATRVEEPREEYSEEDRRSSIVPILLAYFVAMLIGGVTGYAVTTHLLRC